MGRFDGKVVLVTGGGTGIGRAIAEAFLAEGAKVAVSGRRKEPLESVGAGGRKAVPIVANATSASDRTRLIQTVTRELGGLDVLVNNAGAYLAKPLAEATDADEAKVFELNVLAPLSLTREALPHLVKAKGNVLNVSSALATGVFARTSAYSGSKAALDHITRLLAAELGPSGVRVNAVSPAVTETDMSEGFLSDRATAQALVAQTPLRRIATPKDIVGAALFLASSDAGWVTGQALAVSGGMLL